MQLVASEEGGEAPPEAPDASGTTAKRRSQLQRAENELRKAVRKLAAGAAAAADEGSLEEDSSV
jgi:hypothetical protein